jgi:hypothetical protein
MIIVMPSRLVERGVRVVTNVRRDAMDADMPTDEGHERGRRRRVVLAPLGWCQACKVMTLQATVTKRSWTPGRARSKR